MLNILLISRYIWVFPWEFTTLPSFSGQSLQSYCAAWYALTDLFPQDTDIPLMRMWEGDIKSSEVVSVSEMKICSWCLSSLILLSINSDAKEYYHFFYVFILYALKLWRDLGKYLREGLSIPFMYILWFLQHLVPLLISLFIGTLMPLWSSKLSSLLNQ